MLSMSVFHREYDGASSLSRNFENVQDIIYLVATSVSCGAHLLNSEVVKVIGIRRYRNFKNS